MIKQTILTATIVALTASTAFSQMERQRVATDGPVDEVFWAPNLVGMSTVQHMPKQNLNVTIMHNFGLMNEDLFRNFFGLDLGATVRVGLDYGITDGWSIGAGRTSPQKIFDFRTKLALLKQTESNSIPLSVSVKGDLGINTRRQSGLAFEDRLSYFSSLMVARKFGDDLSLQLTPMYSHFNSVFIDEVNDHFAIGVGGEYHLSDRYALMAEYYPVVGDRSAGTKDAFAVGINIETGGHVFQLFLKSSNWHNEQYIIANNTEDFWDGDIRFGFNVNRVFGLGKKP